MADFSFLLGQPAPGVLSSYMGGAQMAYDRRLKQAQTAEAEGKVKEQRRGRLRDYAYAISKTPPEQRPAAVERFKQIAMQIDPENAAEIGSLTPEQFDAAFAALSTPEQSMGMEKTQAEINTENARTGLVGAQTSDQYNQTYNRNRATESGMRVDNAQIANYGASTANTYDEIRSRQGQDMASAYGQLDKQQIYDPQSGRAMDIPGAYRKPTAAGAGVTVDPVTGALTVQAGKDPTEGQSKDMAWLVRARAAEKNINPDYVPSYWDERADANLPFGAGNQVTGEEYRQQRQAWTDWVMAILRKDTGAAISNAEWDYAFRTWLPQANDTPMILAQKAAARQTATNAIETGLPPRLRPAGSGVLATGGDDVNDLLAKYGVQ